MKKCRFLWSAHRITERQKAGKSRSIKGKQLKNSRNQASRLPVAHLSSASADTIPYQQMRFADPRFCPGVCFLRKTVNSLIRLYCGFYFGKLHFGERYFFVANPLTFSPGNDNITKLTCGCGGIGRRARFRF